MQNSCGYNNPRDTNKEARKEMFRLTGPDSASGTLVGAGLKPSIKIDKNLGRARVARQTDKHK